jgi:hypothetical protein
MRRIAMLATSLLCASAIGLSAAPSQSGPAPEASGRLEPAKGGSDIGLIFNTGEILKGLSGYQGGIGLKYGKDSLFVRGLAEVSFTGSTDAASILAGLTVEKHFLPGSISPYYGGFLSGGWKKADGTYTVPLSLGGVGGIEVFLADYISVFAEYCVAADFTFTREPAATDTTFDYTIGSRMGNDAMIGVVIYFMRNGKK